MNNNNIIIAVCQELKNSKIPIVINWINDDSNDYRIYFDDFGRSGFIVRSDIKCEFINFMNDSNFWYIFTYRGKYSH